MTRTNFVPVIQEENSVIFRNRRATVSPDATVRYLNRARTRGSVPDATTRYRYNGAQTRGSVSAQGRNSDPGRFVRGSCLSLVEQRRGDPARQSIPEIPLQEGSRPEVGSQSLLI